MTDKKLVVIDGNAIVHRAYHALPPMTVKGTMVNAVYGFTSMILKVLKDLNPEYLAVTFDVAGGTFRHEKFEKYKATRVKADQSLYDQIPLIHQIVKDFGVPIYEKKGYEADDVIGTIVVKSEKLKVKSVIVTGDMDTMQLIDKNTSVFGMRKGMSDTVMYDSEEVKKKFGFGPEFVVDYKALRGDVSDNIPGVPGIGEKTATELINKIGGIEEIYKQINNPKSKLIKEFSAGVIKKLVEGKENALLSHELATLDCKVPDLDFDLEKCEVKNFDKEKLTESLKKFEFWSLVKRLNGTGDEKSYKQKAISHKFVSEVIEIDKNNLAEFKKIIGEAKEFSCKEILSGNNVLESELLGLVFAVGEKVFYSSYSSSFVKFVKPIFEDKEKVLIGHDLKRLIKALLVLEVEVENKLFDVMVASYVLNSSTKAHDLRAILNRELNVELPAENTQSSLFGVDYKSLGKEVFYTLEVKQKMQKQLEDMENLGLFEKIEMPLILVLAEMEFNGVAIDEKKLNDLSVRVAKEIEKVTKKIWQESGEEFNPASSVQLREVLFEKLGLPTQGIKKGKTGYSTADPELEKLTGMHPIVELMRDYRELAKLQSTYVDVLPTLVNKKTNRIHTTFNQAVTTTGRLSSSDPNLQNIPIRTDMGREIREAFVSEPGNLLVVADYSQIELRVVASLSEDKKMLEIFEKNEDIHKATAAIINGVELKDVTKQMRSAAKAVNFGVLYGMGSYGLSARTDLSRFEAQAFIRKYFEQFSGVKKYLDQTLELAKKEGYVETLFGRRRYIPELLSDNFQLRSAGERMAINMPVQGTAADLMKMAMIDVFEKIKKYKNNVRLILQVHDELVLEVKKDLADEVAKLVKDSMENVAKLRVPIEVSVGIGVRWGEIK